MTAKNGVLERKVNGVDGTKLKAVSTAERFQAKRSAMTKDRDDLAAKCKEIALEVNCVLVSAEEWKSLRARVVELEDTSKRNH